MKTGKKISVVLTVFMLMNFCSSINAQSDEYQIMMKSLLEKLQKSQKYTKLPRAYKMNKQMLEKLIELLLLWSEMKDKLSPTEKNFFIDAMNKFYEDTRNNQGIIDEQLEDLRNKKEELEKIDEGEKKDVPIA